MGLIQALQQAGEPIFFYPAFAQICESVTCGIFISRMLFWEGKQSDAEGWIYKTQADITKETGLTRYEMDTVKNTLKKLEIIVTKRAGVPAKLYFKFNWQQVEDLVVKHINTKPQTREKAPAVTKEKIKPLIHQMTEIFTKHHVLEYPENPYHFTDKDFGQMDNLVRAFRSQVLAMKQRSDATASTVDDKDIIIAWDVFLEKLPLHYKKTQFYPSGLYSNFSAIFGIKEIK